MTPLLEDEATSQFDVLAIQEPWYNDRNCSTYNPSSSAFHLAHGDYENFRTCFYVNKGLQIEHWETQYTNGDYCRLKIKYQRSRSMEQECYLWVHNVYNPSPTNKQEDQENELYNALSEALDQPGEHVLLGDFNLHHPRWNNPGRTDSHEEANRLLGLTDSRNMALALPDGVTTWAGRGVQSTIDLVFLTRGAHDALQTCDTREDLQVGSDHLPIVTELNLIWERQPLRKRKAWRRLEDESLKNKVMTNATRLSTELGRPLMTTTDQIDAYTNQMITGLQEIIERTIPDANPCQRSKTFWNAECSRAVKEAKQKRRHYNRSRSPRTEQEWREAERNKVKILRTTQAIYFRKNVHEASQSPKGVWRLCKHGRERNSTPKASPQFPPLREEDHVVEDFQGKVRTLRHTFFPPSRQADLSDIAATLHPTPLLTDNNITTSEIRQAIAKPKPDRAPGPSGITNRFLKVITAHSGMLDRIVHLFQACWDAGFHPQRFKEANTIVLKKPKKSDYTSPKSYRPIALLETLGKALEAIVARRLSDCAELHNLLPNEQFGARTRRSVETALEVLTESVHTIWANGKGNVASLLSLDVAGAFDNVSHDRLIHNMKRQGVPTRIIQWTRSFLTDRYTSLTLGSKTSSMERVTNGIPQGSPISPILFLFFNGTLLEDCGKLSLPVISGGFVDDIHILAYSETTERNCEILEEAHRTCSAWALSHGASFAPHKYELVHFTRMRRRHNFSATVRINGVEIRPQPAIRILGLYMDTKLNWNAHISHIRERMGSQIQGLKMVAASTWGASLKKARTIYSVAVRPAMTFAARIWHQPNVDRGRPEVIAKQLTLEQNKCLRIVTGAYRSTPVPVLEAESNIPDIRTQLDYITLSGMDKNGIHCVTTAQCQKIRTQLFDTRRSPNQTPMTQKLKWAENVLSQIDMQNADTRGHVGPRAQQWRLERSRKKWDGYRSTVPIASRSQAQHENWSTTRINIHDGLQKAESTAAVQLRTGHNGFSVYLHKRKVPGFELPTCQCGWAKQDSKHVLIFCPLYQNSRNQLFETAGTSDYRVMMSTTKGIRAAARWLVQSEALAQFSLARRQLKPN